MSDPIQQALASLDETRSLIEKITIWPNPLLPVKPDNKPKLTKGDVRRVREMSRNGCTYADIARCMDVHPSTISRTVRGHYN